MQLQLENVYYAYGKHVILQDISRTFHPGLYGLLGSNGAGKTTLMRIMASAMQPDRGHVYLDDMDLSDCKERKIARERLGFLPQSFDLMDGATALHNVQYAAWLYGGTWQQAGKQAEGMLDSLGLQEQRNTQVKRLSGGMRQRVGIACSLASRPDVLLLDEPSVGLDPLQRMDLRKLLEDYAQHHVVIISTHLVEDVVAMGSHILILHDGSIVFDGTANELANLGERDGLITQWESGYRSLVK